MATSGSLTTSKYDGRYYKLAWERTSYSTANNTSTIKWTLSAVGGNSSWYAERTLKVVIAGTTVKSKTSSVNRYTGEIDSGTITIKHNSDGSKSFSASVQAAVYYSSVNCTGSKTFELTSIPRESTISATSAYVENQSTITVNRKSTAFSHTITWACGSASGTVVTKSTSTSIKWTLPTSLYAQIGSTGKSKTVTLTCKTYNSSGSQVGGSKVCTLTAQTSASRNGPTINPTITTYAKTQELCGNGTTLIAGVSEAGIVFNAAAQDSATLSSKKVTNSGKSRTTDGDFSNCTSGEFVFTATDSRGYTTTVTKKLTVIPYIKPTIKMKASMNGTTAKLTANGKFFNGSFGAKTNALTITFRYKVEGGSYSAWTAFSSASPGANSWSASHTLTGLDSSKTYVVQAQVSDLADYSATTEEKTIRFNPVWDWGESTFHVHGSMIVDNCMSIAGRHTNGTDIVNVGWVDTNNNVCIGGGSHKPANIYMDANGGAIQVNGGGGYMNLVGIAKAMTTTYTIPCTVTNGDGYSGGTAAATLIGNCLRLNFSSSRDSDTGEGNITNETVMTININHGGKIDSLYRVSASSDITGGPAHFSVQAATVDENNITITVILTATGAAVKSLTSYCVMPANINSYAY